jgi:phage gp29-like protein
MAKTTQKGWVARALGAFTSPAKPAVPADDAPARQVTVIIRPNVRDRWSSTLLSYYTPERVETVARGALSGNLYALWQMFDLMEQTWPELATCLNELKDQAIAEITENYTLKSPLADLRKRDPEADRRKDIVEYILAHMAPDLAADENDFEDTLRDMMDDVGKCVSVLEMNFADGPQTVEIGGKSMAIVPLLSTRWVNPRYYGYPMGDQIEDRLMLNRAELLRNNPNALFGVPPSGGSGQPPKGGTPNAQWMDFPPDKFILAIYKQKSGHPVSGSLLRQLVFLWAMGNFTWEWAFSFLQIFGMPLRIAKVDPNAPDAVKTEIDNLLTDFAASGQIRVPVGNDIEILEAMKGGNDSVHKAFLEYIDQICRKRVLGQTLTGGEGQHGTQALGRVHATVRNDKIQSVAKRHVKIMNTQAIPAICRANFGDTRLMPQMVTPEKDNEDPLEKMQRVQIFTTIAPMSEAELYDIAGFKVPEAGEKTIGGVALGVPPLGGPGQPPKGGTPNPDPKKDAASTATASARYAGTPVHPEVVKLFAESLAEDLQPLRSALAKIETISDNALFEQKMREFISDHGPLVKLLADINAYPKSAKVINELNTQALASALAAPKPGEGGTAKAAIAQAGGDLPGHEFHGNQYTDAIASYGAMKEQAQRTLPEYTKTIQSIAEKHGAAFKVANIKEQDRTVAKIVTDYKGDSSRVKDMVRGTIIARDEAHANQIAQSIEKDHGVTGRNLWAPGSDSFHSTGYKDAKYNLKVGGMQTEVQVSTPAMLAAKHEAHPIMKQMVEISRARTNENRPFTDGEKSQMRQLLLKQQAIYSFKKGAAV